MRGVFLCLLFVLTILSFGTLSAHAQSASVSGQVVDASGALIPNVQITLTNTATNTALKTKTNNVGIYNFPFVKPGKYSLVGENPGFASYTENNITVSTAQALEVDFRLKIANGSQSVIVDGSGAQINTIDAGVSTVIDHQFVENIPLSGRSFQPLLTLIPGVVQVRGDTGNSGEFSVNGQRSEANYFTVDGVGVNTGILVDLAPGGGAGFAGATLGETSLGTTQSVISIDALQEFDAKTSSYSAEYGRTPGGQFSFSSRSGTNAFHGSAFDYFRNGATSANAWFNNYYGQQRLIEHQNDFGGTLGGPVVVPGLYNGREKTFFFFSYEGLRLSNPVAAELTAVPSLAARSAAPAGLQTILNAFPVPAANATDLGEGMVGYTSGYSSPGTLDTFSVRFDQHLGDKLLLFGRASYAPSNTVIRSTWDLSNPETRRSTLGSITLGATATLTPHVSNDFRFNFTRNKQISVDTVDNFGNATTFQTSNFPGLTSGDSVGMYLFGGTIGAIINTGRAQTRQRQINVVDTFDVTLGRHQLRGGLDYRGLFSSQHTYGYWEWGMALSQNSLTTGDLDLLALYRSGPDPHPVYQNYSLFLQDAWKLNPRLTLSYGLRWDANPAPTDSKGNDPYTVDQVRDLATTKLAPRGTPLWKTSFTNFAPRLGLNWQAHQTPGHETIVRAGGGIFYDTGSANGSNAYYGPGSINKYFGSGQFPLPASTVASLPAANADDPYASTVYAYVPDFKTPYTAQWNVAVEQALGPQQSLSVSYVASIGRRLLAQRELYPDAFGNDAFSEDQGLHLTTNNATSSYSSLQVQMKRRLASGLQAMVSYVWAHSLDDSSTNFLANELQHASSDFDVRNNFNAAVTYTIPTVQSNGFVKALERNWSLDTRVSARSATPVDVVSNTGVDVATSITTYYHPDRVPGAPLYQYGSAYPGGRIINPAAYSTPADASGTPLDVEGNAGRNSARGFDAVQTDLAIRREFHLGDGVGLQFRAEAFNLFNHAIFGAIYNQLNSSPTSATGSTLFGQAYETLNTSLGALNSLYQNGGPRSMQFALRLHF